MVCSHDFWVASELVYPDYEKELRFYGIYDTEKMNKDLQEIEEQKEAKKAFRFYKTFALDLICNFERKISKKIVFSLNKVICRKVYKDFRFYFVGV